ncbi:MAG: glutamate racemase [Actinomycetota bacterium]|nr:glutamate racemase [Actinomycetota bacterium]
MADSRPIGVFDSGVGGLTVARAILDLAPHEPLVYVGDNARFPYGPKPVAQIRRYALEIADYLVRRDVKMLVVACNSIEVSAIGDIAIRAGIPVIGVIDPGARAAAHVTRSGVVGLIGTQATVESRAYDRAMAAVRPDIELHSQACPAFVEHVERGDTTSDELLEAARGYLSPLVTKEIDTLILGCTHYPLLSGLLQRELGPDVVLVSSAKETAKDVYALLLDGGLEREGAAPLRHEFLATGDPEQFQRVARVFWGHELSEVRATRAEPAGGGSWS